MRMHARTLTWNGTSSVSLLPVFSQLSFYLLEAIDVADKERRKRGGGDMGGGYAQDARLGGAERTGTQRARPLCVVAARCSACFACPLCRPVRSPEAASGVLWRHTRR
jgi:hypothetical protein